MQRHAFVIVLMLLAAGSLATRQTDDVSPSIAVDSLPSESKLPQGDDEASATSISLSQSSLVIALHDDNYDEFVRDVSQLSVVLFYAPWSKRSKQFISDLTDASEALKDKLSNVSFGIVNCAGHKKLCKHARVARLPLLRVVVRGNVDTPHVFSHHHENTKEIVDFIESVKASDRRRAARDKKQADELAAKPKDMENPTPGVPYELDPESFVTYTSSTQLLVMVFFYAPWCVSCTGMLGTLLDVADYFLPDKKVVIGKIDCERYQAFCIEKGIQGYPTLMTYAKPSISKAGSAYTGEMSSADIKNYLDLQNFYTHSDELMQMKEQFEKYSKMSEEERPLDPSEMGGIFGTFAADGKSSEENKPERIGGDPRKPMEEQWHW